MLNNESLHNNGDATNSITIDHLVFNIKDASVSQENRFGAAGEGYRFLNIHLSVKNEGSTVEQMTSHMVFKLHDMDNQVYNIFLPEEEGLNGILKPEQEINGKISFKVREGKEKFKLEIKPWIGEGLKEYVSINL